MVVDLITLVLLRRPKVVQESRTLILRPEEKDSYVFLDWIFNFVRYLDMS